MYRLVQNLRLDRRRARKHGSELWDVAAGGRHGGRDVQGPVGLGAHGEAMPFPAQPARVAALVCSDRASGREAATEIGTVMGRLARARPKLHARRAPLLRAGTAPDRPAETPLRRTRAGTRL
jgi:hypothetical protein